MRLRTLGLGALAAALGMVIPGPAAVSAAANLRISGNKLIDGRGRGHVVQLRGVNRSGTEYACIQGWGFFDSPHPDQPDSPGMIAAMKSWRINAVRVPLNEDCWLGINTPAGRGGAPYQRIIEQYVRELNAAHLYVILDLHVAAPGSTPSIHIDRMPDADHAPTFWRSVASTFKNNHTLVFDLYNEPNHVDWGCWQQGCTIPAYDDGYGLQPSYRAASMQQLLDAVRSVGAAQPVMAGGINWSLDLSQWLSHPLDDPLHRLAASEHNYGILSPCTGGCRSAILAVHKHHPVVIGELGETDCRHSYIDGFMRFADRHRLSYLGWTWDAGGGWTCTGGPTLISDYSGTPTPFGIGLRNHLRALGKPRRPS